MLQELQEKQKQKVSMQEELEELNESLRSDKQNLAKVTSDRDRLRSWCDEKEKALQVSIINLVDLNFFNLPY